VQLLHPSKNLGRNARRPGSQAVDHVVRGSASLGKGPTDSSYRRRRNWPSRSVACGMGWRATTAGFSNLVVAHRRLALETASAASERTASSHARGRLAGRAGVVTDPCFVGLDPTGPVTSRQIDFGRVFGRIGHGKGRAFDKTRLSSKVAAPAPWQSAGLIPETSPIWRRNVKSATSRASSTPRKPHFSRNGGW
jgi:hypothetical protein